MNLVAVFLLFAFFYLLFIWKAGVTYPILYLFLFTYFLQYVFSVYLIYNEYPVLKKQMPIKAEELFNYILPALFSLFSGVFLFNKDVPVKEALKKIIPKEAAHLGYLLMGCSFFIDVMALLDIPNIRSIYSFTYFLKFSGAMCLLFARSFANYVLIGLVYLTLAGQALRGGVFIDFFIWATYLFVMFSLRFDLSFKVRAAFILLAGPLLILIQSVKLEYREATWYGKRQSGVGLVTELAQKKQKEQDDPFARSEGVIRTVGRLNQGWHLGKVLKWVPKREPFAEGSDILGDIEGTLIPRVFSPNKKVIGSRDKFLKYTGHRLSESTSMTIGVLGDFYVNFGATGSFIMLFIFGAIMARALYWFFQKYVLPDPINIVWVPFLFSYLVRANNDFYIVINNLVKGFLIFLLMNYLRGQFWPKAASKKLNSL